MPGVVLETLSYKKLGLFAFFLLSLQVVSFLVGGLIAPSPNTSEQILLSKCIDRQKSLDKWYHLRPMGNGSCPELIHGELGNSKLDNVNGDQIVFVAQFPLPRDNVSLKMSRWFQQIIAVLMLDIEYQKNFVIHDDAMVTFDVRLGYKNSDDSDWKEIARSFETRPLKCVTDLAHVKGDEFDGSYYDCEIIPLFTLGHVSHEQYLVNIRLPMSVNKHLGKLQDVWMVEIHQNGGFTKVWLGIKTFAFPLSLLATIFFWNRIVQLDREPSLLERTIFGLGIVLCFLNLPIEWLSFKLNFPFWLVLSDIRQGAFYAALVCFWLVFTKEHLMKEEIGEGLNIDNQNDAKYRFVKILRSWGIDDDYWPKLFLIIVCTTSLFLFEIAERGVQVLNPFYNIWSNPVATKFGIFFMALGSICAVIYLGYLIYMVAKALLGILGKRSVISQMPDVRRRFYTGVVYRFTILLAYTIVCAVLTVIFYLFSQWNEDSWKWGNQSKIEYSSAFITGVYGMWNIYVISILCLYAPSHKQFSSMQAESIQNLVSETNVDQGDTISMQSLNEEKKKPSSKKDSGFHFIQKVNLN